MIYLASPYSHELASVRQERFDEVCEFASALMNAGHHVFSPIAHTHPIAVAGGLGLDWQYWAAFDDWFVSRCDKLAVLRLDGWESSTGVKAEIALARKYGKPVFYVDASARRAAIERLRMDNLWPTAETRNGGESWEIA